MLGVIDDTRLENIAGAIREKTGAETTYTPEKMPAGVTEVYDKGRTDEQNAFWDKFTLNGERTWYGYAFAGFRDEHIRPNRKIIPRGSYSSDNIPAYAHMFAYNNRIKKVESQYFDFSQINTDNFKLSQTTHQQGNRQIAYQCFALEEFEDVGMIAGCYYYTWNRCSNLHTIAIIRSKETTIYNNAFSYCSSLQNVRFEGEIGRNLSISYSPLSIESIKDIILHLVNYKGTASEGAYTLTLKDTCKAALEADTEIVSFNGQNYTYFNLITAKGWNLA